MIEYLSISLTGMWGEVLFCHSRGLLLVPCFIKGPPTHHFYILAIQILITRAPS